MQIVLKFRELLPTAVVEEFDNVVATIKAFWSREHNADGTHGAVTCTSLSVAGVAVTGGGGGGGVPADIVCNSLKTRPDGSSATLSCLIVTDGTSLQGGVVQNQQADGTLFAHNITFDPVAGQFNRLATNRAAGLIQSAGGQWSFWNAVAVGPNPATIVQQALISAAGNLSLAGLIQERGRGTPLGEWTDVPFNASDFTCASAGTWTVIAANISTFKYMVVGKTLFISLRILNTTIATAAPTELRVKIPGGFTLGASSNDPAPANLRLNGTVYETGLIQANPAGFLAIFRTNFSSNYIVSAGNNDLRAQCWVSLA